jgi:intracellular septation protein
MNTPAKPSPLLKLALDLGPLIVFFVAFQYLGIYGATAAFMVAILASLAVGYLREGKISPMPLFSAVLVVIFGSLTLYLKNDAFIKLKLTVFYAFAGIVLLGGLAFDRLFIKYVFADAFDLSEAGWRGLTWRWGFFAFALAALNEIVWRNFSTPVWVDFKVWAIIPLTFVFALVQTPFVLRHEKPQKDEPQTEGES